MKKVLAICLIIVMMMSFGVTAYANSPASTPAPIIVTFTPSDPDCTAKVVVTLYGDRAELSETLHALFEKAYSSIINANSLTDLNSAFKDLVKGKGIDPSKLAVSNLFDLHVTDCDFHDGHTEFDIVMGAEALKNFVGLLHMNKDGEWELVTDAEVINNGEHIKFSVESFSPFAIIVDTTASSDVPTGDSMMHIYLSLLAVASLTFAFVLVKSRKQKA